MQTSDFVYDLPEEAIAQTPAEPRDAARLLDTRDMSDHVFAELPDLLPADALMVVNTTRVRAARLTGRKAETGGAVELLLLEDLGEGRWTALARPARRLRPGTVIEMEGTSVVVEEGPVSGRVVVHMGDDGERLAAGHGSMPLPPYIRGELADPERYQTVFGRRVGSAAAPTAGLHFTTSLLEALARAGIEMAGVDLQVGLDTFRPIATASIGDHVMHSERYHVPAETAAAVDGARVAGRPIVAVGTTVMRTLESAGASGSVQAGEGTTSLFIRPGHQFRIVDALVTNFHAPASSLLVLLSAFIGRRWRDVYGTALRRGYRFLSFGDAMYAERTAPGRSP